MTYHYGSYWADIRPVHSTDGAEISHWQYRIFESGTDRFLFDGHDAEFEEARAAAESNIDRLNQERHSTSKAA